MNVLYGKQDVNSVEWAPQERAILRDELAPALRREMERGRVNAIAGEISVSRGTLYNFLDESRLPSSKTIRKVRAWIERGKTGTRPEVRQSAELYIAPELQRMVTEHVMKLGPPGEATDQKLAGLQAQLDYLRKMRQPTPPWLFELWKRIERGDA